MQEVALELQGERRNFVMDALAFLRQVEDGPAPVGVRELAVEPAVLDELRDGAAHGHLVEHRALRHLDRGKPREASQYRDNAPFRNGQAEALVVNARDPGAYGMGQYGQPVGQEVLEDELVGHCLSRFCAVMLREQ